MTTTAEIRQLILTFIDSQGHTRATVAEASRLYSWLSGLLFDCAKKLDFVVRDIVKTRSFANSEADFIWHSEPARKRLRCKGWIGIPTAPLEALLTQLKTLPTMYINEMADSLFQSGFEAFTPTQIWRALNSRGITRKVFEVHAKEQNEERRQEFLRVTSIYTAEQRFYVDERCTSSVSSISQLISPNSAICLFAAT